MYHVPHNYHGIIDAPITDTLYHAFLALGISIRTQINVIFKKLHTY